MRVGLDHPLKLQLRPSKLPRRLNVPGPLLKRQLCLQNDHVLCPANRHGPGQHFWGAFVCAIKLPHPTQVSGREAGGVRIRTVQILRRCDSRALFRPATDQFTNLSVQLHLRQSFRHQRVQRSEHGAVVYRLSDVHPDISFPLLLTKIINPCPGTNMDQMIHHRAVHGQGHPVDESAWPEISLLPRLGFV